MAKKIALGFLAVLVIIQFFRPGRNISTEIITDRDISKVHAMPVDVHKLLIAKCYDCHSNNTNYPWYANIQPVAWWLADHVNEGKGELNFSEFASYEKKKADHKLEEVGEVVGDETMPLESYTLLHPETKITAEDKKAILGWLNSIGIKPH